ncbi:MAG: LptF/LptG family permease [Planctomycetota bacterium]|jgi:lipopolysaccharide export LptBFGC system permease protein LptF|nr:LptF/LptG family permease [Planctomycetota bacterium]
MSKSGRFPGDDQSLSASPPDAPPGATGFYYIIPGSEWEYSAGATRRSFGMLFLLPSYIMRELIKGVVLATAVFSVILMGVFAGQVLKDGIGAYTMAKVIPNFIPLICPFVLPLGIITGILLCYSRLAKDNEIMAAYAGGVGPIWLMVPALLVSIVAIFITLTLNEIAIMPAINRIERLIVEDQADILMRMMTRPGNITVPAGDEFLSMSKLDPAGDAHGRSALDITRFSRADNKEGSIWDHRYPYPTKRIVSRDHEVRDFSEDGVNQLVLKMSIFKPVFQDLHEDNIDRSFIADSESGEERVVLANRPNTSINARRTTFWPILMLSDTRREAMERMAEMDAAGKRIENLPETQRRDAEERYARLGRVVRHRTAEINMRLALAFSCFAFAILGIPLGMRTRGSMATSFATGIAVSAIYFLLLKSGEMQVSRGLLPYWAIWIPDVLMLLYGSLLWRKNTIVR